MNCKDLIEYLQEFDSDIDVAFIVGNPEKRIIHTIDRCILIVGGDNPALMLETRKSESMDGFSEMLGEPAQ